VVAHPFRSRRAGERVKAMATAADIAPQRGLLMIRLFENWRRFARANLIPQRSTTDATAMLRVPIGVAVLPLGRGRERQSPDVAGLFCRVSDFSFLAEERWGRYVPVGGLQASGRWRWHSRPLLLCLSSPIVSGYRRLRERAWMPAPMPRSCRRSVLPGLVGFGAVVAMLPAVCNGTRLGAFNRGRAHWSR